jgi:hypothetical protein
MVLEHRVGSAGEKKDARGRGVILHVAADSDPRCSEALVCHVSKCGNFVSNFFLCWQNRSVNLKNVISGVAIRYNGKKLNIPVRVRPLGSSPVSSFVTRQYEAVSRIPRRCGVDGGDDDLGLGPAGQGVLG